MSEGIQTEIYAPAARLHSHRVSPVPVPRMRQTIPPAVASHATPAHPHEREAVRVRVLPSLLPPADDSQPAPAHSHRREAVQVRAVRQGLPTEGDPRPAHADASRRSAVLLPDAELPATIRDRAGGEEAHRQSHEPARGEGTTRGRFEDATATPARVRSREARAVLPAVLRSSVPTVPGVERRRRVQAVTGSGRCRLLSHVAVTRRPRTRRASPALASRPRPPRVSASRPLRGPALLLDAAPPPRRGRRAIALVVQYTR